MQLLGSDTYANYDLDHRVRQSASSSADRQLDSIAYALSSSAQAKIKVLFHYHNLRIFKTTSNAQNLTTDSCMQHDNVLMHQRSVSTEDSMESHRFVPVLASFSHRISGIHLVFLVSSHTPTSNMIIDVPSQIHTYVDHKR